MCFSFIASYLLVCVPCPSFFSIHEDVKDLLLVSRRYISFQIKFGSVIVYLLLTWRVLVDSFFFCFYLFTSVLLIVKFLSVMVNIFFISFASKRAVMSYLLILFVFFGMLLSVNFASNFELFSVSVLCFFFGFPLLFTNWPKRICRNVLCVWLSVVSA